MKKVEFWLGSNYVRQGGKIFPFGLVRIYANGVVDDLEDEHGGLELWSEKLLKYGDGNFYAKTSDHNTLCVFSKENNELVEEICVDEIFISDTWVVRVVETGHLHTIGKLGLPFSNAEGAPFWLDHMKEIEEGKEVSFVDNSPFVRVSKDLVGQELVNVSFSEFPGYECKIFTLDCKFVESIVEYPFKKCIKSFSFDGDDYSNR